MIDIGKAMAVLLPDSLWVCMEDTYETLEMLDGTNKPTLEELESVSALVVQAQYKAELIIAIQNHIDNTAKDRGYDNINACAKYLRDSSPFHNECVTLLDWCDSVWAYAFNFEQELSSGVRRTQPTIEELILELPSLR